MRLHQVIAARKYMADATLNFAKFTSRAMASNITSPHHLWLCHWQADMGTKLCLTVAPFKGENFFGEALDPILVEGRDKIFSLTRPDDPTDALPYCRQSFQSTDPGFQSPAPSHSFNPLSDRFQDRQQFRDRNRHPQSKWPFWGSNFCPYRRK